MAFFTKWYKNQTELIKQKVKQLISEKRFEFINGGYVMHDEATSYYQHTIDQMRLGLLFLKQEFDYVPEVAWFIDPFGHSASNAYILSKMGFKKIVLVRIDYKDKEARKANKSLEFYWVPFGRIDESARIFTHVTHDHYNPPAGLEDFTSDKELSLGKNEIKMRASKLLESIKNINSKYKHMHHLLMYGDDFTFNKADKNFLNIEKLMKYVNDNEENLGLRLVYSTPSKYFESVFEQVEDWPQAKNIDFFPYADGEFAYWTGFFSSRPYLKGLIREVGNYLAKVSYNIFDLILNVKGLEAKIQRSWFNMGKQEENAKSKLFKDFIDKNIQKLYELREVLAVCQHHDAVSGTARELVSQDYINMLFERMKESKKLFAKMMGEYMQVKNMGVCLDPVVDLNCQKDILNSLGNEQKVRLRVDKGKCFFSENHPLKSFYFDAEYQIKSRNTVEDDSELFCVDELKNKIPNCQVYFNNQTDFTIAKSKRIFLNTFSISFTIYYKL